VVELLITTSRKPGMKTRAFARDLAKSFPNSVYFSRGKSSLGNLFDHAVFEGKKTVLIIGEKHGNPVEVQAVKLKENEFSYALKAFIKVMKLRKELGNERRKFSSLKLVEVKEKTKKFLNEINAEFNKNSDNKLIESDYAVSFYLNEKEIGPRFKIEKLIE